MPVRIAMPMPLRPDEDELLMHTYDSLPSNCKKYWPKRYDLFSRFDDGVYMSSELWYSVTPERCARFVARWLRQLLPKDAAVVDVCCGGGGNCIQLAREFDRVVAIDINETNVYCTMHNASIYECADHIVPVVGDWLELSCKPETWVPNWPGKLDVVFCSPPWGGPGYKKRVKGPQPPFDAEAMEPLGLEVLLRLCKPLAKTVVLFLPRNTDLDQVYDATKRHYPGEMCRVIRLLDHGKSIGLAVMWGELVEREMEWVEECIPYEDEL